MTGSAPTRRGPNAVRYARTRASLLAAARTVFAEEGFIGARTDDISERAGVTRGGLYHHFEDKVALFDAVIESIAMEIQKRVDSATEQIPSNLDDLIVGCEEFLAAMSDPALHRLYLIEAPATLGMNRWREIDGRYAGRALRDGVVATLTDYSMSHVDAEALAALISGAINEGALWAAEQGDEPIAQASVRDSVRWMLNRVFGAGNGDGTSQSFH